MRQAEKAIYQLIRTAVSGSIPESLPANERSRGMYEGDGRMAMKQSCMYTFANKKRFGYIKIEY